MKEDLTQLNVKDKTINNNKLLIIHDMETKVATKLKQNIKPTM